MVKQSDEIDQLAAALVAIQAEVPAIPKDATNPFFKSKYADLPIVMETAQPIVTKHGVAVSQDPDFDGTHDLLTTTLMHTSGQWKQATMRLHLPKADPQGQGSALTYARRYAYMAALGLVADQDDDGSAASRKAAVPKGAKAMPASPAAEQAAARVAAKFASQQPPDNGLASNVEPGNPWPKNSPEWIAEEKAKALAIRDQVKVEQ